MKKYEEPKIEIILFDPKDIIAASGDQEEQTGGWNGPDDPIDLPMAGI